MNGQRPAVAIVGAGSAGTTAAWRLHSLFEGDVDLTVFERGPHVGGRAWDVPFAGTRVEVGGTVLHSTGKHTMAMMEFTGAKPAASSLSIDGKNETYAFWTSAGFPIFTRTSLAAMALAIVRHVGPSSALKVTGSARQLAERWSRVYVLQSAGEVYTTPEELLGALDLARETTVSMREHLLSQGVSERMVTDVVEAIVHNMYNQGAEICALAGEVGLAGAGLAGGYLFAVEGGNWTLFDKVLKKIGADVRLGTAVTRVEGRTVAGAAPRYRLSTTAGDAGDFDAVVIAAPFALSGLKLCMDDLPLTYPVHQYQEVHTTLVAGELSGEFFGLKPGRKLPSTVFVADSAGAPFKSVGVTGFSPVHQSRIYKVFSADKAVDPAVLRKLFPRIHEVYRFVWPGAYPRLTPRIAHLPFVLQPGLFYACAFETAAAAIEVEAVGGFNAGTLAARHLDHAR